MRGREQLVAPNLAPKCSNILFAPLPPPPQACQQQGAGWQEGSHGGAALGGATDDDHGINDEEDDLPQPGRALKRQRTMAPLSQLLDRCPGEIGGRGFVGLCWMGCLGCAYWSGLDFRPGAPCPAPPFTHPYTYASTQGLVRPGALGPRGGTAAAPAWPWPPASFPGRPALWTDPPARREPGCLAGGRGAAGQRGDSGRWVQ